MVENPYTPATQEDAFKIGKLYKAWMGMKERCSNKNRDNYKNYGGRGIKVCSRWEDFKKFYSDVGVPPDGMSLDRIDNDKGYSTENCRWATSKEQNQNRRITRLIHFEDKTMCLADWAIEVGIDAETLSNRLSKWGVEKALALKKNESIQIFEYEGRKYSAKALSRYLHIPYSCFIQRLKKMPLNEAIKYPYYARNIIEYKGVSNSLTGWAKSIGMSANALRERIYKYGLEKAIETPKGGKLAC